MKLAAGSRVDEMDPAEFLEQAAEYELDATGARNRIYKFLTPSLTPSGEPPILVARATRLDRWVRGGEYGAILAGDYPRRDDDAGFTLRQSTRQQREASRSAREQRRQDKEVRDQQLRGPGLSLSRRTGRPGE
ncbi:hypothetical protein [Actinacidiphila sp. ITFR-21]|uniref:hypothetical protein n=1 Tax=Actinacidiphila sp. ITFR-21 TaxID=3075199 RepID=UPI00288A2C55|nr:hypothetical protein [Streptomyces sp. ITFR-21]WNI16413.1 hypothetical protein RLT57_13410 [Streptomyces sp. ITFR-21]